MYNLQFEMVTINWSCFHKYLPNNTNSAVKFTVGCVKNISFDTKILECLKRKSSKIGPGSFNKQMSILPKLLAYSILPRPINSIKHKNIINIDSQPAIFHFV